MPIKNDEFSEMMSEDYEKEKEKEINMMRMRMMKGEVQMVMRRIILTAIPPWSSSAEISRLIHGT
jgi:vacuolar-type H+-ATPase subunit E/Vma4